MPNVGPMELIVVGIIALVIFGPKRLPELGKSMGHGIREFKGSLSGDSDDDEKPEITAATAATLPTDPATSDPTALEGEVVGQARS